MRLYLAIIFAALVAVLGIGWRLGAIEPLWLIAREQQTDQKMIWLGAFDDYAPYKIARIKLVQPEVLLVGSSRCGQAREQVFRPYKTYNACLTAWPLQHVADFIERATRVSKPRVVIVALDYFLFGDGLADTWQKERAMDYRQDFGSYKRKMRDVIDFAERNKWDLKKVAAEIIWDQFEPIDHSRLIGTEAIRGQFGFRNDGSTSVFSGYRAIASDLLAHGAENVSVAFPGGQHLSETQFGYIDQLAKLGKERNFTVVAIQFPFVKSATDFLDNDRAYQPYAGLWQGLRSAETAQRFDALGVKFFDMSRDPLNADPMNFFDPAHPSERGILKTVISLMDRKAFREVFPKIDKQALENDLALSPGQQFDLYH